MRAKQRHCIHTSYSIENGHGSGSGSCRDQERRARWNKVNPNVACFAIAVNMGDLSGLYVSSDRLQIRSS